MRKSAYGVRVTLWYFGEHTDSDPGLQHAGRHGKLVVLRSSTLSMCFSFVTRKWK